MKSWLLAFAALVIVPPAARSQTVEITPVVGYRFGGSFTAGTGTGPQGDFGAYEVDAAATFGVQVALRVSRDGEIEALYSRQDTRASTGSLFMATPAFDLALESWHAGGNYLFEEEDARVRPYIGMGLGLTRLIPASASLRDESRFSASFAAGAKVWLGRHVGLRVEARGFFTFLGDSGQGSCQTGHGCVLQASGDVISQADARAGLVLRF